MGEKNGEWSYHMDPNGHMVPCANHPCRLHGGNDIVASSTEEAYRKANAEAPEGLSTGASAGKGDAEDDGRDPDQVGNAWLRPFRPNPSLISPGSYYRLSDGMVYHVRQLNAFLNAYSEVDPRTGREDPEYSTLNKVLDLDEGVTAKPIQPIKPKGMDGSLTARRETDKEGHVIISVTSKDGERMVLNPVDESEPDIKNTLREYGFRYDENDESDRGGWDPLECRCHHINGIR